MIINTNFDTLTLIDNGIVLCCKNNQKREISFSELDKIYMKVYKLKPIYEFAFILFPFLIILFCIQYIMLEKVMFMALFTVIPVFVKTYRYKRNGLVICLKDGTIFRKKVSLKLKAENVAIVNAVKRGWLNYGVKTKEINELESVNFSHSMAS